MRYYFYKGPVNLEERFPDLVKNSFYRYPVTEIAYYVNLPGGDKVEVLDVGGGWQSLLMDKDTDSYIQRNRPEVFTEERIMEESWLPTSEVEGDGSWLSILVEGGKIIGSYAGHVYIDELGRRFSKGSFITISPEYQGRGLCREFATFTYERLLSVYQVDYIAIFVASTIGAGACRCYIRAAQDLGLYVFGKGENYIIAKPEDCQTRDLDSLIFSIFPILDEVMINQE
ncbi:Acyl-CoA N-acyltransferase [Brazilian cedratvirus IHUMI]|uniref:Acyl-CoA N-acyltransferase n=1 Tax=Brazilian cedratvirus IHUMI TaxID=2126980 RepID=A0A2R8FEF9_9VIRU|nr:Acyl-CoA N-acyltransferase [Brazilian cedratvirus IHUMI]